MNWTALTTEEQIEKIKVESKTQPVLIFKHSTRCSISSTALGRLERKFKTEDMSPLKTYILDLLAHRNISNHVAEIFEVEHESPQVLIVKEGSPVYVKSHLAISFEEIRQLLSKN